MNNVTGIHPIISEQTQDVIGTIPGEYYFAVVLLGFTVLVCLLVIYLIVFVWGNPILLAASAKRKGYAIIQHFQNSKVGQLKTAPIFCGAIRHQKIADGTLISIPRGITNLRGISFVSSWNLTGITIPCFLTGGISVLREIGIKSLDQLNEVIKTGGIDYKTNLISDGYYFNGSFEKIILQNKNPSHINLQIEYVCDFIGNINPHYTESEISKEVQSYLMKIKDNFVLTILMTAIAVFIIFLGLYILLGAIK